ncbi:uracil-xanthine permease family protein [Proteiniclasticum sp. C24MP]|uniref:uracil-xanthine permease family protein n=1 Tax=Proteiniclasticum sp. C24MP TaxID=3374101 RepID=UPI0037546523
MAAITAKKKMETENRFIAINSGKDIILALQHLIAMFGATVLVPMLTGLNPSVALFSAGVGTLLFHLVTGGTVPVFLGSSFAFIAVINIVKEANGGDLAYAQGGILVAGLLYVLASFAVKKIKYETIKKILPSYVVGPMIMVIGLTLVPTAYGMAQGNLILASVTLLTALGINLFGKGMLKQMSIITAVAVGYILSLILGQVDTTIITSAALVEMPAFTFPKFSVSAILTIAPVVLAVFMEHVGDITTNGQVVGKDFIKKPGLHRTLLGDGLATAFAALIGGPANTTYGENTGVLAITKNYSPQLLRLAAVFAVVLAFVGKLGGTLRSIPTPVMGGISIILFSMIALIGLKTIRKAYEDKEVKVELKTVVTAAAILIIGLAPTYLPAEVASIFSVKITEAISLSGLSLAAIAGIILNTIFGFAGRK